jgi:hypothetical protein
MIEKRSTGWRQFDTASATSQQLRAYLVLEVSNLPAERGLRRVQFSRRCHRQTSSFGHGNEIAKVS